MKGKESPDVVGRRRGKKGPARHPLGTRGLMFFQEAVRIRETKGEAMSERKTSYKQKGVSNKVDTELFLINFFGFLHVSLAHASCEEKTPVELPEISSQAFFF